MLAWSDCLSNHTKIVYLNSYHVWLYLIQDNLSSFWFIWVILSVKLRHGDKSFLEFLRLLESCWVYQTVHLNYSRPSESLWVCLSVHWAIWVTLKLFEFILVLLSLCWLKLVNLSYGESCWVYLRVNLSLTCPYESYWIYQSASIWILNFSFHLSHSSQFESLRLSLSLSERPF